MTRPNRRPVMIIGLATTLLVVGTAGYILIEGWPFLDALYMTVITLSTVGFGEIHPLSSAGRLFTTALVAASVFLIAYGVEFIARLGGQYLRKRQMKRDIRNMKDHVIVCGYGRVGESAVSAPTGSGREIIMGASISSGGGL